MPFPLLGPGFVLLFLKHCVIPYSFPLCPGVILTATYSCVSHWLWSHASSKFLVFFFFFAFPCIFHDLPLNGVHPPEQSCFFQCISCFLCLLPPLCSRMSTVGASYEPASCHSNRSHTGKSPGLKELCQMQAIEFEEFCFSYKKSSERHWTPKAEWHRYKIPIELWAGF